MPPTKEYSKWLTYGIPAALIVLGLTIDLLLFQRPLEVTRGREVGRAIGDAFLVAGLLGLIVDRFLKRDLIRDIQKNTSSYIFGFVLPKEMCSQLEEIVRETVLIRRKCKWVIHVTKIEGRTGRYHWASLFEYEIHNPTSHGVSHNHMHYVECSSASLDDAAKDNEGFLDRVIGSVDGKRYDLARKVVADQKELFHDTYKKNDHWVWKRQVLIPKNGFGYFRGDTVKQIQESDTDVLHFSCATIGVEIEITCPPDLYFESSLSFMEGVEDNGKKGGSEDSYNWLSSRAYVTGQSVWISWKPQEMHDSRQHATPVSKVV